MKGTIRVTYLQSINYRRTNFNILINMDETKNWKLIATTEDGEPLLKYDPHHDETVNVITGEVIQGH